MLRVQGWLGNLLFAYSIYLVFYLQIFYLQILSSFRFYIIIFVLLSVFKY